MEDGAARAGLGGLKCRGKNVDQASWVTQSHPSWPDPAPSPIGVPGVAAPPRRHPSAALSPSHLP